MSQASTQEHIIIQDIKEDLVILKNGSMCLVLETSAVNFGLLSENEQLAIIGAFASFLNSLSFPIQLVIKSKRLDISSYLHLLSEAQKKQTNPLLNQIMSRYRSFVEKTVKENEVLDKKFYVVISVSYLELGITKDIEGHFKKALTILLPRRDHIIRQLNRVSLRITQLNTKQLIKLFYEIYNPPKETTPVTQEEVIPAKPIQNIPKVPQPTAPQPIPTQQRVPQPAQSNLTSEPRIANSGSPFIVEELPDDYSTI